MASSVHLQTTLTLRMATLIVPTNFPRYHSIMPPTFHRSGTASRGRQNPEEYLAAKNSNTLPSLVTSLRMIPGTTTIVILRSLPLVVPRKTDVEKAHRRGRKSLSTTPRMLDVWVGFKVLQDMEELGRCRIPFHFHLMTSFAFRTILMITYSLLIISPRPIRIRTVHVLTQELNVCNTVSPFSGNCR